MSNFLKTGNSQQNFETDKALKQTGDFDVNAGEVVELTFSGGTTASGQHTITQPVGAMQIARQLTSPAFIEWVAGPNTLDATANVGVSGTMKFLVF